MIETILIFMHGKTEPLVRIVANSEDAIKLAEEVGDLEQSEFDRASVRVEYEPVVTMQGKKIEEAQSMDFYDYAGLVGYLGRAR